GTLMALLRSLKPSARDDFADAANRSGRPTATQEGKAPSLRPTCHEFAGGSVTTLHAGMHQKREKPRWRGISRRWRRFCMKLRDLSRNVDTGAELRRLRRASKSCASYS